MTLAGGTSVEMVRDRSAGCKRVDGHRDPATSLSRDGYNDRCQRAEAGRGPCCLHACLVTGAARPSRTLCGSTRRDGTTGIGGLVDRFLWHLPDRSDRELRLPRPGLGQTGAGGAGLPEPIFACGDHQWVGGHPVSRALLILAV